MVWNICKLVSLLLLSDFIVLNLIKLKKRHLILPMKSGYTVQKLLKEFWVPSSSIFSKAIEFIPDRQSKDIEEKFKEILAKQSDGFPKESIESISLLKDTRINELDEIWLEAIEEATSTLPELLILDQNDSHYEPREGDSPLISIGKILKKGKRYFRKGIHATNNTYRRVFKKPEQEFEVDTREVPFKSLAQILLFELQTGISDWKHAQYRFCARVFEVTQSWALTGKIDGESESEVTFKELISNLKTTFNDESNAHQTALESKFKELETKLKQNLELVGTIELSADTYSDENVEKGKTDFSSTLRISSTNWTELVESLSMRIQLILNLVSLKEKLKYNASTFLHKTEEFYQYVILDSHKELKQFIENAVEELKGLNKPTIKELSEIGASIHSKAKETIIQEISEPLNQKIEEKYLSILSDEFISQMTGLAKDQPEKSIIIEDIELEPSKPKYEIKEIEWQKFVQRMIGKFIASELDSRKLNFEEEVSEIAQNYLEVLQIIETNLVVIEEVSGKEEENPIEVALQGLERSLNKVEEIEEDVLSARDQISEKVRNQNEELMDQLSGFLIKQDVSEMKWMETQLKVKESAGDWTTKFTVQWARLLDRLDLFRRFIFKKYRQNEAAVRTFLGLKKPVSQNVESTNLATFLYETDQKIEELPFIYRRLFDFYRDVEANFFIQNSVHFNNCRKAHELWKGGFPSSISIIGEKGSGKSTLVRFLNEEILNQKKHYSLPFLKTYWKKESMLKAIAKSLQLPEVDSMEELVVSIKKKRKGSIVVIENLQNCYVRNMNGYESIRALLYIISETKKEIFWVATCSRYAWNFLNVVFRIGDYFSHSIATDKLNSDEIESLIMKRQKASGYQLQFIPDASILKSRAYKKLLNDEEATQEYLQGKYFQKLTSLAEGNATVAMILWIRSIKEFNDSHFILESLDIINMASLDGLDSLSLFTLSAFILHDSLTPAELAMVLNDTESNCEMTISRLASRGLLVGSNKYYTVNDLIYRQVVRILRSRNILH
tara:strand:- start:41407 stop:44448 length:3042 start_codon:yes stop_codon:yes gene_type:complete